MSQPVQSPDKEHGEEEAVRGQQGPHLLGVPQEDHEENHGRHGTPADTTRPHHDCRTILAGRRGDRNAEQPLYGPAHQEAENCR